MAKELKRIIVLTSGGDAPGMNAAIRGVIRSCAYYGIEVYGSVRGYNGLIDNNIIPLSSQSASNIIQRGGTILKTARSKGFLTVEGRAEAAANLKALNIEAVVAIGGNGTYTGAQIFFEEHAIPMIGIPGTIDNDIWGTDFTLGFDTAVNTALDAVDKIRDTADSHDRLFFIEVMGRHSGAIAVDVGIAGGAEAILVPEIHTDLEHLVQLLEGANRRKKTSMIVIVAEGGDGGGIQKIAETVKERCPYFDIRVSVLGHLQRGGMPNARDRVLGSRLGYAAVRALREGKTHHAAGIVNNTIHFCELIEATTNKKEINTNLFTIAEILSY